MHLLTILISMSTWYVVFNIISKYDQSKCFLMYA